MGGEGERDGRRGNEVEKVSGKEGEGEGAREGWTMKEIGGERECVYVR